VTDPISDALVEEYLQLVDDSCIAILPHALRILTELDVPAALADGPMEVARLSTMVGADAGSLYRLLRAMATVGFVTEAPAQRFALTARGRRLLPGTAGSLHHSIGNLESQSAWIEGAKTIRSGKAAFADAHGASFFAHKEQDGDANHDFTQRMRERAGRCYANVAELVDWSTSTVVLDIGGSDGFLLHRILTAAAHLRGVLFDRPSVAAPAPAGLNGRWQCVAGDFFERVPPGADTHLLGSVLHDWDDDLATTILRNSRAALTPGGRLLMVEMVVPTTGEWHASKWSDVGMMILTGGRERTEPEFRALLARVGYVLTAVTPVPGSAFSVLEAV
jgi:hypothetical protein